MTRAATLRRLAWQETPTDLPDGAGGALPGWVPVAEHWVALQPVSGRETYEGARETSRVSHRVLLRCPRALRPRPTQRFRIGSGTYAIRAVFDRDGRGRFLTCLVEEETSAP